MTEITIPDKYIQEIKKHGARPSDVGLHGETPLELKEYLVTNLLMILLYKQLKVT